MANALEVTDPLSNTEEHIERAAKTIGRSRVRRKIFEAIYHHKKKQKSVSEIVAKTKIKRMRVLQIGQDFWQKNLVRKTTIDGEIAYEKIDTFQAHKTKILELAGNAKKIASFPTKRKNSIAGSITIRIPRAQAKVERLTIDDVASFTKVKKIQAKNFLPSSMSETQFKHGIQRIIGEPGQFKDWGGEKSDLYSTRVRLATRRVAAAFAFKGPGLNGKLVPSRMGKNGDQALRLFQEDAEVFFVQHWREIDPSVIDLMRNLAVAKSVATGKKIFYGIIDGNDSERLRLAYSDNFVSRHR